MDSRKWPRTYHLGSSPGLMNDDRRLPDLSGFHDAAGRPRICLYSRKMDGEGTTLTSEITYPRSPDGRYHPSRDLMKAFHARRAASIPTDWRISGEYMHALHSIEYSRANGNALPSWFLGFGVWNEHNVLLPWDETLDVFEMLDILPIPTLHVGPFDLATIDRLAAETDTSIEEGIVVRVVDAIEYPSGPGDAGRFFREVAKWVRPRHVTSATHWASGAYRANELVEGTDGL